MGLPSLREGVQDNISFPNPWEFTTVFMFMSRSAAAWDHQITGVYWLRAYLMNAGCDWLKMPEPIPYSSSSIP